MITGLEGSVGIAEGKEPFAFAMTWWLASLINQEVEPATQNPSHLMPQLSALLQALSIDTGAARSEVSYRLCTACYCQKLARALTMNIARVIFQRSLAGRGCKYVPGVGPVPSAIELSRLVTLKSGLMAALLTGCVHMPEGTVVAP